MNEFDDKKNQNQNSQQDMNQDVNSGGKGGQSSASQDPADMTVEEAEVDDMSDVEVEDDTSEMSAEIAE